MQRKENCHGLHSCLDVKFHEFFWREIFHEILREIFLKYLKKFHDVFSGSTK